MNARQRKQYKKWQRVHLRKFMGLLSELADAIEAGKENPKEVAAHMRELITESLKEMERQP